jgi:hypothetical protein
MDVLAAAGGSGGAGVGGLGWWLILGVIVIMALSALMKFLRGKR